MSINDVGVPPAKHMQPGALDVKEVGLIHQGYVAVSAAATPHRTLHTLLGQLGGVAGLQQNNTKTHISCCSRSCAQMAAPGSASPQLFPPQKAKWPIPTTGNEAFCMSSSVLLYLGPGGCLCNSSSKQSTKCLGGSSPWHCTPASTLPALQTVVGPGLASTSTWVG